MIRIRMIHRLRPLNLLVVLVPELDLRRDLDHARGDPVVRGVGGRALRRVVEVPGAVDGLVGVVHGVEFEEAFVVLRSPIHAFVISASLIPYRPHRQLSIIKMPRSTIILVHLHPKIVTRVIGGAGHVLLL